MRTWAIGRAERPRPLSGFTLVELLVTIAVVGLAAAAVVLVAPDPRPGVRDEAERLAARLVEARQEALLGARPTAVEFTADGYGFAHAEGALWRPLTDGPFGPELWDAETRAQVVPAEGRVTFDPTGVAEGAEITLARDGRRVRVVVDAAGEVSVR